MLQIHNEKTININLYGYVYGHTLLRKKRAIIISIYCYPLKHARIRIELSLNIFYCCVKFNQKKYTLFKNPNRLSIAVQANVKFSEHSVNVFMENEDERVSEEEDDSFTNSMF